MHGSEGGWDESCMLNAYLVDEANPVLDAEMVRADRERWDRESAESFRKLIASIRDGDTSDMDPDLLELAQRAVAAQPES
jgi:hypothetical protein